jgi:predicted DCC family thiol-disulfide oxidoreductase YuxK
MKVSVNTEMTDKGARNGHVLYDGECRICTGFVRRWRDGLRRRGFECVPLQTPWVRERLNLSETELMLEMRVLDHTGKVAGGADALLTLARHFWWALPLVWFAHLPGGFRLLDDLYRWAAARRYCVNGACTIPRRRHWYLVPLPLLVPLLARDAAPWVVMWVMAGALWLGLKLFTFFDVPRRPWRRSLAYLLAWPGMDAPEFFANGPVARPTMRDWLFGGLNFLCGSALIYGAARLLFAHSALLAGWAGMAGVVLVLHFGIFKGLGLLWRRLGIPATPLMDAPLLSPSLSEFWGRRWNTAFSIPARRYLMAPIARKFGTAAGLLAVFLVSGFVHDLVISVPARGGYGLPTLYFVIQGAALVHERRHHANRWLTLLCVAAPAGILFHPPFIHNVIIPFLKAIGAL